MSKRREIFVFGSNLAGRHGKGSAYKALKSHGAVRGRGIGIQGNSYAIPTKDAQMQVLPLERIERYVDGFLRFAQTHPDWRFRVVEIGCGFAGYEPKQIAPLFAGAPENVLLSKGFVEILNG